MPQQISIQPPESVTATLHFAAGLPGFPHLHDFVMAPWGPETSPFSTIIAVDDPDVGFIVVSPFVFHPDYDFELDSGTAKRLGLVAAEMAYVVCIVTLQDRPEDATINLLGPIVVNTASGEACQAVLPNGGYQTRTPLARVA
jgi:flagellar assembly factor FliW